MYPIAPPVLCNLETEYKSILKTTLSVSCSLFLFFIFFFFRPLVKMSITWRKDGAVVNTGIRDFGRRLVISLPAVSDSGYYECEASLRSSSVPSVTAGAYLHVLGKQRSNIHFDPTESSLA